MPYMSLETYGYYLNLRGDQTVPRSDNPGRGRHQSDKARQNTTSSQGGTRDQVATPSQGSKASPDITPSQGPTKEASEPESKPEPGPGFAPEHFHHGIGSSHIRRTLDQFYYPSLADTTARDGDQTISKWTGERLTQDSRNIVPNDSLLIMIDQLWCWVVDRGKLLNIHMIKEDSMLNMCKIPSSHVSHHCHQMAALSILNTYIEAYKNKSSTAVLCGILRQWLC